ncbi:MAG: hypothetical protein ACXABD_15755 [Candidatus Thorarchaeota archaeon]|jgi:hypothetical protein
MIALTFGNHKLIVRATASRRVRVEKYNDLDGRWNMSNLDYCAPGDDWVTKCLDHFNAPIMQEAIKDAICMWVVTNDGWMIEGRIPHEMSTVP